MNNMNGFLPISVTDAPLTAAVASVITGFTVDEIDRSINERFEMIVQRYPDQIAVQSAEQRLTYTVLNGMANTLARLI